MTNQTYNTTYRESILKSFKEYTDAYNSSDIKIKLKIDHTYRVAALCQSIAESLCLSAVDTDIAWTCGMLHDIGRFEQVRQYGTFFDSQSVDHAQFGADLLFCEDLYSRLVPCNLADYQQKTIEKSIRVHNMFRVPNDLTDKELIFANILRDADKIDILKVNYDTPIEEIYNTTREAFLTSSVSEDVKKAFDEHRCAKRHDRTTPIDFVVGHICLFFELVYPRSVELAHSQGYIYKMLDFPSTNPDTCQWFEHMKDEIATYMSQFDFYKS